MKKPRKINKANKNRQVQLSPFLVERVGDRKIAAATELTSKFYSDLIVPQAVNILAKSVADYKAAVALALDNENPDRSALADLYGNLLLDNHLASMIDTRLLFTMQNPFKITDEKGNENEDLTWLLQRSWFEELMCLVLFSKFQGTTLIELFDLNAEGEIAETNEIPQAHFIAKKGLIIKEVGDINGWQYKEGAFANYYVQIGKDRDLGILERLAPMILAKKLGFGAWMDFIDKYGVPPLFITTDREDNARLQQLFNAALNFKKNSFMVGRGQEKFEVGDTHAGNAKDTFDVFIERINDEISKRILGGAGLTDEKGFVGSVEMQFKLLQTRFNADKLFFKYIFNSEIKPRLVALSPVYKSFENHYFEWDDSEQQTAKQTAELVQILYNSGFETDAEFVEQQTGVKITGSRGDVGVPDDAKK